MTRLAAGAIVLVDWRGGARPKEPNKLRPAIVVEDDGLFSDDYPNIIVVPLTEETELAMPSLSIAIDPTAENGCTKRLLKPINLSGMKPKKTHQSGVWALQ